MSTQPFGMDSASKREGALGGEGNSITVQEREEAFSPSAGHWGQLIPSPPGLVTAPCLPGVLMRSQQWIPEKVVPSELEGGGQGRGGGRRGGEMHRLCDSSKSIL